MNDAIRVVVEAAIKEYVFPGAVVGYTTPDTTQVLPFGRLTYDKNAEKVTEETIYDLASVTKVIPTNSIILNLIESGLLSAEDQVIKFLPEIDNRYREEMLIKHLLTFTVLFDLQHRLTSYASGGIKAIFDALYKAPLKYPPGQQYHYSNAPSILLGLIAEKILSKPLNQIADETFFQPLGMKSTTFHPEKLTQSLIAPTEINERGLVRGQVHDETAWALFQAGMISGHAGAFSSVPDLLAFGHMILSGGEYGGRRYFAPSTIKKMGMELINDGNFGMSLGWEMNQSDYMSPHTSSRVFGKDGFTGTMLLIEPEKKRCLVVLSNRTYPKRPETAEEINTVRRRLAEIVLT